MSLRDGLKEVTLPEKVKSLEKDLEAMHNIKNVKYGNKVKFSS